MGRGSVNSVIPQEVIGIFSLSQSNVPCQGILNLFRKVERLSLCCEIALARKGGTNRSKFIRAKSNAHEVTLVFD